MRRPRLHRPTPTAWSHPYTGVAGLAVFYNDGGNTPAPTPADLAARTQPPAAPPAPAAGDDDEKVSLTQRRLNVIMRDEKEEGRRAGRTAAFKELAQAAGIDPDTFDPATFGNMFKQAEQARQAQLSDEQRRAEELAQRERDIEARLAAAEQREAAAAQRDRETLIRSALVTLGATGDDLDDAYALVSGRIPADADGSAITEAATALKDRRGELFGGTTAAALPPAPSGAPAGGPPARTPASGKDAINKSARERAIRMGLRDDDAA